MATSTKKEVRQKQSSSSSQETANKLKDLLKEIPDDRADAARLDDLRRLLAALVQQGDLVFTNESTENDGALVQAKWNAWLQKRHKIAVNQLVKRIMAGKRTAVRTLWGLLATSPQTTTSAHAHAYVHAELLFQWLRAIVQMPIDPTADKSLRHLLEAELSQRDVQYYALVAITRWANESYQAHRTNNKKGKAGGITVQEQADRMLNILMMISFPKSQGALDSNQSKYLFPPPAVKVGKGEKTGQATQYLDQDKEEVSSQESESENSSEEEDISDEESEEEEGDNKANQPARKKQKMEHRQYTFAYQDVNCHKKVLAKAWMAIFRMPLSTSALKKALPFLSHSILPNVRQPIRFADLFMHAYSGASGSDDSDFAVAAHGSTVIPLLALDGLFYLMTEHRLEYPLFYAQLYGLLRPKLFYVKYRARFFALLQKCLLRNEMLPAHIVAAFLKRLLQCALKAPPSGALFVLALSSNLLRQHEECSALIHRTQLEEDEYDPHTDDPVKCNALQSSLWEVAALEKHYHPAVSTLAMSIGREDPKSPLLQLDEMAQHTYDSLIEQERKRKAGKKRKHTSTYDKDAKAATPVTFVPPTGLFAATDIFAGVLKVPPASSEA